MAMDSLSNAVASDSTVGTAAKDTQIQLCPSRGVPGYELGELLGRGGMGDVYRAPDLELDREVAVKILQEHYPPDSPAAARFLEEAKITAQLQHPGIPAIYRAARLPDGRPFLAMKLIKGRTLDELLFAKDPLNQLAVIEALGDAHAHDVIHRDLKPLNVMVGSFGEVQVMDWGLAKVLATGDMETASPPHGPSDPFRTAAGAIMGNARLHGSRASARRTRRYPRRRFRLGRLLGGNPNGQAGFRRHHRTRDNREVGRWRLRGVLHHPYSTAKWRRPATRRRRDALPLQNAYRASKSW
jgi:serine/threonine protein kinase